MNIHEFETLYEIDPEILIKFYMKLRGYTRQEAEEEVLKYERVSGKTRHE